MLIPLLCMQFFRRRLSGDIRLTLNLTYHIVIDSSRMKTCWIDSIGLQFLKHPVNVPGKQVIISLQSGKVVAETPFLQLLHVNIVRVEARPRDSSEMMLSTV